MYARTLFFGLLMLPATSVANTLWEDAGGWQVFINADTVSCFATRSFEDGSRVEIGAEPSLKGGYFAIYNAAWTHIKEGDVGTVEFDFDDARFGGEAQARFSDGQPGGYAFFNNPAFIDAFSNRYSVKIIGGSGLTFDMDLTGTKKAVAAVIACQSDQIAATEAD